MWVMVIHSTRQGDPPQNIFQITSCSFLASVGLADGIYEAHFSSTIRLFCDPVFWMFRPSRALLKYCPAILSAFPWWHAFQTLSLCLSIFSNLGKLSIFQIVNPGFFWVNSSSFNLSCLFYILLKAEYLLKAWFKPHFQHLPWKSHPLPSIITR